MTFPFVAEQVRVGALHLHGWYFDIEEGELYARAPDGGFRPLCGTGAIVDDG